MARVVGRPTALPISLAARKAFDDMMLFLRRRALKFVIDNIIKCWTSTTSMDADAVL